MHLNPKPLVKNYKKIFTTKRNKENRTDQQMEDPTVDFVEPVEEKILPGKKNASSNTMAINCHIRTKEAKK